MVFKTLVKGKTMQNKEKQDIYSRITNPIVQPPGQGVRP
jgi:hypothetical protein